MSVPTCGRCGETPGFGVGLPVFVGFDTDGVATIIVDMSEVDDEMTPLCKCTGMDEAEFVATYGIRLGPYESPAGLWTEQELDFMRAALSEVAKNAEVKERFQLT